MSTLTNFFSSPYLGIGYVFLYLFSIILLCYIYLSLQGAISKRKTRLDIRLRVNCSDIIFLELISKDISFQLLHDTENIMFSEMIFYRKTMTRLDLVECFIKGVLSASEKIYELNTNGYRLAHLTDLKVKINKQLEDSNHPEIKLNPIQLSIITDAINIVSKVDDCEEKEYKEIFIKLYYLFLKLKYVNAFV